MLRILLVDKDQPVIQDNHCGFTRLELSEGSGPSRRRIAQTIAEQPPFDLITIGHFSGYGFSLATAVPYAQRGRVVIMSGNPFPPEVQADYERLGVTMFCGREDAYAQFVQEWVARQPTSAPATNPGTT